MKKKCLYLLFFVCFPLFSQKLQTVDAKYVLKNSTDTLHAQLRVYVYKTGYYQLDESFFGGDIIMRKEGKRHPVSEKNIQYLEYTINDIKQVKVSVPEIHKKQLVKVKLEGKISWYRFYQKNPMGIVNFITDYFIKDDGKGVSAASNMAYQYRNRLKTLLSDDSEALEALAAIKNTSDLIDLLEQYNQRANGNTNLDQENKQTVEE